MKRFLWRCLYHVGRVAIIVDANVLVRVERIAQAIQRATGYDCFDLRNCCWAALGVLVFLGIVTTGDLPFWGAVLISLLCLISAAFYFTALHMHRKHIDAGEREKYTQFLNPKKLMLFAIFLRVLFLFADVLLTALYLWFHDGWRGVAINYLICLTFYLDACNPLPPCSGKLREWLSRRSSPVHQGT